MSPSSNPALRVRDILDAVDAIERYATDAGGVDALIGAPSVYRDGIERRLLIISEAATKLTGQVEALEPAIDWRAIRGMGNILRHDYDGVSDEIVRRVLTVELPVLRAACERLASRFA
ncbi:MAG: HepT-like ribonuclease domain-containing protein [Pseudomonadota bacterium]